MDGCSWMLQAAAGDDMRGGNTSRCSWASGDPGLLCDVEQEAMMSSYAMQQQLSQACMQSSLLINCCE
ncbi:hypothetical protein ABZP36_029644 [Zizania latifolia]